MEHKTIALPRLNNLSPNLESTMIKLMEETGELAQVVGKCRGLNGEACPMEEKDAMALVAKELLDVAQTAVSMMYVLEENHGIDIGESLEQHVQKLINKGYLSK